MKYCWVFDTDVYKNIYIEDGIIDLEKCGVSKIRVQEFPKRNNLKPNSEFLNGFIKGWNEFRDRMMNGKQGGRWSD